MCMTGMAFALWPLQPKCVITCKKTTCN
jgi:hypothetical protein